MSELKFIRACQGLSLAMLSWLTVPCVAAAADTSSSDDGSRLQEIVVTAQKRTENIQDVPSAITVVSAATLENQGLVQLSDYAKEIPGLTLQATNSSGSGFLTIRGLATGADSNSLVAVYVDDIPQTPSAPATGFATYFYDPDPSEIDHVEVLEGPQSTLYGASAMGGLIKFVTKQPDLTNYSGDVRVDGSQIDGGGAGYAVRGSVNIPVVNDMIAVRASAFYRDDPGFVTNQFNGEKNVNWDSVKGGRLAVLFKFNDDLQTTLSGQVQNTDTPNSEQVYLNPATLRPLYGSLSYSSPIPAVNNVDSTVVSDATHWDMHFATLTNVASYARFLQDSLGDLSSYGSYFSAPPQYHFEFRSLGISNRVNDELRLTSAPGRFEWMLSGFYTNERDSASDYNHGTDENGQVLDPDNSFYNVLTFRQDVKFTEKAVFGDLTYHFTNNLEATVGARYSENDTPVHTVEDGLLEGGNTINTGNTSSSSADTYLATISYRPEADTMLYLRTSSGYRPGGSYVVNPILQALGVADTYQPDHVWNYEAGIKGSLDDRRVVYSADVFRMVWVGLQLDATIDRVDVPTNVGSAKSDGVEAAVKFVPVNGLTASVNGAYVHARITADVPSINAVVGQPLPYSPRVTASAVADYRLNAVGQVTPTMGLTYAYHGAVETGFTGAAGFSSSVYTLPSYSTLDLRAGVEWSRYTFLFRALNVANRYGVTYAATSAAGGTPLVGYVLQPRTFGLSVAAHF